jgi:FKBP-type peptidyl-prolyl cis-trans isomerase
MKSLTRYETIGITISIVVVMAVLGVIRFFPFVQRTAETEKTSESDIIRVNPNASDKEAALRQAILDGTTGNGTVTKLIVHDLSVGTGREVKVGDTVTVNYIGLLKDGPEFDNSYKKKKPFSFKVGADEVIKGWDTGIIGMKEGGQRALVVPASLGYGNTIVGPLPANATLIFSIELLSIE